MAAPARKFAPTQRWRRQDRNLAQATLKMAARGPLASERRLSCCLTSAPTRTPAPRPQLRFAAPLPTVGTGRGAWRRRARAAAGTGAGSPLSAPRRTREDPRQSRRAVRPLRSAPLRSRRAPEMLSGLRRRLLPPGSDPRRQIRRRALQEIVAGAPSFPSVAVCVPDASGRTNPVAFMSNVLCACRCWDKEDSCGHLQRQRERERAAEKESSRWKWAGTRELAPTRPRIRAGSAQGMTSDFHF
ncbi:uncharacterized protein LOC135416936 [Pseudopipra pipra]|uniref:uncharacterized protein LOC135416936 n=1 Tax=Pseudopipra pipra TaxID=415032 RepID=UPI003139C5AD